jgi:RNA polymerase sigma-70 factor (ECF subfamily)
VSNELQSSSSTSPSLIQRARDQDPEAWRRISRLYTPLVYGWARQAGLAPTDASDIGQEVFRSVVANLERFRHDEPTSSFRGWLWTITRNQIRLHFRQKRNRPEVAGGTEHRQRVERLPDLLEQDSEPSTSDAQKSLVHRAIRIVRNDFQENTWQAFWRLTVEGHSAAEIAADLDMNPRSVRQAKYRILSRLREELADQ